MTELEYMVVEGTGGPTESDIQTQVTPDVPNPSDSGTASPESSVDDDAPQSEVGDESLTIQLTPEMIRELLATQKQVIEQFRVKIEGQTEINKALLKALQTLVDRVAALEKTQVEAPSLEVQEAPLPQEEAGTDAAGSDSTSMTEEIGADSAVNVASPDVEQQVA